MTLNYSEDFTDSSIPVYTIRTDWKRAGADSESPQEYRSLPGQLVFDDGVVVMPDEMTVPKTDLVIRDVNELMLPRRLVCRSLSLTTDFRLRRLRLPDYLEADAVTLIISSKHTESLASMEIHFSDSMYIVQGCPIGSLRYVAKSSYPTARVTISESQLTRLVGSGKLLDIRLTDNASLTEVQGLVAEFFDFQRLPRLAKLDDTSYCTERMNIRDCPLLTLSPRTVPANLIIQNSPLVRLQVQA